MAKAMVETKKVQYWPHSGDGSTYTHPITGNITQHIFNLPDRQVRVELTPGAGPYGTEQLRVVDNRGNYKCFEYKTHRDRGQYRLWIEECRIDGIAVQMITLSKLNGWSGFTRLCRRFTILA